MLKPNHTPIVTSKVEWLWQSDSRFLAKDTMQLQAQQKTNSGLTLAIWTLYKATVRFMKLTFSKYVQRPCNRPNSPRFYLPWCRRATINTLIKSWLPCMHTKYSRKSGPVTPKDSTNKLSSKINLSCAHCLACGLSHLTLRISIWTQTKMKELYASCPPSIGARNHSNTSPLHP